MLPLWWSAGCTFAIMLFKVSKLLLEVVNSTACREMRDIGYLLKNVKFNSRGGPVGDFLHFRNRDEFFPSHKRNDEGGWVVQPNSKT